MKTRRFFLLLCIPILIGLSCTNPDEFDTEVSDSLDELSLTAKLYDKEYIKTANLDEQLDYRTFHMTELVNKMAESGIAPSDLFNQYTQKGDDEVKLYFRDILESNAIDRKGNLDKNTRYSMSAFEGLSEDDMDPYITKVKDGDDSDPLFLISTYDMKSKKEVVIGYRFNSKNKLKKLKGTLTEEDVLGSASGKVAMARAVYKISPDGCNEAIKKGACSGGGTGGGTGSSTNDTAIIQYAKIKDKKESWIDRGDVQYERLTDFSPILPYYTMDTCGSSPVQSCNYGGAFFANVNNSEVGENRLFNRALGIKDSRGYQSAMYVIFEHDKWPAAINTFERIVNNTTFRAEWRSYQTEYDKYMVTFNPSRPDNLPYGVGIKRSNDDIEYNIK